MPADYLTALELARDRARMAAYRRTELSLEQIEWAIREILWLRKVVKRHQEMGR